MDQTNRNAYQREYMRTRRAANPQSQKGRMKRALETIASELADSNTEKGRKLRNLATAALTP